MKISITLNTQTVVLCASSSHIVAFEDFQYAAPSTTWTWATCSRIKIFLFNIHLIETENIKGICFEGRENVSLVRIQNCVDIFCIFSKAISCRVEVQHPTGNFSLYYETNVHSTFSIYRACVLCSLNEIAGRLFRLFVIISASKSSDCDCY